MSQPSPALAGGRSRASAKKARTFSGVGGEHDRMHAGDHAAILATHQRCLPGTALSLNSANFGDFGNSAVVDLRGGRLGWRQVSSR
jgi:hypothetical protein